MQSCAVLLVEASKLTDDKNLGNFFEAEKRSDFFQSFFIPVLWLSKQRDKKVQKKSDSFSASKIFPKFLSFVNLLGVASTNKTAHLYTL